LFSVLACASIITGVILYAAYTPPDFASGLRNSTVVEEKREYSACFIVVIMSAVGCLLSAIVIALWRPALESEAEVEKRRVPSASEQIAAARSRGDGASSSQSADPKDVTIRETSHDMYKVRQKKTNALAAILVAAIGGVFIVAGAAVTDWQIQSYVLSQSLFGAQTNSPQAVNVLVGLEYVRAEVGCFSFSTTWSEIHNYYDRPEFKNNPDLVKQGETYDRYLAAGATALTVFAATIIAIILFVLVNVYYVIFMKPVVVLRWVTLVLAAGATAGGVVGLILWSAIKPQDELLIFFQNPSRQNVQLEVTEKRVLNGSSLYLCVFGVVVMFFATILQYFFKPIVVEVSNEEESA
jgi:hypothetical protein